MGCFIAKGAPRSDIFSVKALTASPPLRTRRPLLLSRLSEATGEEKGQG